jgi:formylglycine-generating enzyme required for sulfatase activity
MSRAAALTATDLDLCVVPAGIAWVGSTRVEVEATASAWGHRLIDPTYGPEDLLEWLSKEVEVHPVEVRPFLLARHPVTVADYACFRQATGHRAAPAVSSIDLDVEPERADHPVAGLDLPDVQAYCSWQSDRLGRDVRLPTEAEWEWAARGPDRPAYPWGDDFDPDRCATWESSPNRTVPVGSHPAAASWVGAEDLAGNVEEWTSTPYSPYPGGALVVDHLAVANPDGYLVIRGGSCGMGGDAARSARRHGPIGGEAFSHRGLRMVVEGR